MKNTIPFDGGEVDTGTVRIEDVDSNDYPDFCDAFISEAEFVDGTPLTDEQLEKFTEENPELVYEMAYERFVDMGSDRADYILDVD